MAVLGEWQRDWAREETAAGLGSIIFDHGGASGVALAWEMQLLASRANSGTDYVQPAETDPDGVACR